LASPWRRAFLRRHGATVWAREIADASRYLVPSLNLRQPEPEPKDTTWSPESFDTGPYVWVREGSEVVAAAGTHFETPFVGQIANVLVRDDRRGKGLGAAVTAAVARRLREHGKIVSLFVKADNEPAKRLYERLGFKRVRSLVYLELA
jgi:ribosomal protein S18 acetylase RimI-like enzyme